MTRDEAMNPALQAVMHSKIGVVKVVEDCAPRSGVATVLVGLKYPHRLDGKTTFTIADYSQWADLEGRLR